MNKEKKQKQHLIVMLIIMTFIFVQSALPGDLSGKESGLLAALIELIYHGDPAQVSFAIRKCAHFTEYLILGISLVPVIKDRMCIKSDKKINNVSIYERNRIHGRMPAGLMAWLAGTGYAVTDEIHQILTPGRDCSLRDMIIDSCGVAFGILILYLIGRIKDR